jgi:hypothetical protein
MAMAKTIGVIILIGVVLWVVFGLLGLLAWAVWTFIKFLIIAAVIGAIYHHFARKKVRSDP